MTQGHPVVERYLTSFEASVNEFDVPEQEAITHEIRNHIAEARAAGTALDAILRTLGPADVLARACAVELHLADLQVNGMPPAVAMTVGPMIMVTGGAALVLFRFYIRFLVTAVQKVFPAARGTALARAFST